MSTLNQSDPAYIEATTHFLEGNWKEAEAGFLALQKKWPESEYIVMTLGNIYYSLGKLETAVSMYRSAVKLKASYGIAWYKLGVCLFRMGKLLEAKEAFTKVLSGTNQSHAMASYFLGLTTWLLGQDADAEKAFATFRGISSESLIANYFLAQLKIKEQKFAEGIEVLSELLAGSPEFSEAHYMLGHCYYGLHKNQEAIAAYRKALALSPDDQRIKTKLTLLTEMDW